MTQYTLFMHFKAPSVLHIPQMIISCTSERALGDHRVLLLESLVVLLQRQERGISAALTLSLFRVIVGHEHLGCMQGVMTYNDI